jgi:hypothetical protein
VNGAVLDFETVNSFDVTVFVKDSAIPPLEHSVPLTIIVTDVNEAPFVPLQEREIAEEINPAMEIRLEGSTSCLTVPANVEIGFKVTMLECEATRPAPKQQFSFSTDGRIRITDSKSLCVASDGLNGLIVEQCHAGRRDFQKFVKYQWAAGSDSGALCLANGAQQCIGAKAQLVVEIVDAAQFTVAFSPRPGVSVGDPVFASDIDAGQTPRLRYYIKTQDSNAGPNGFRIDPETAQLTVDEAYLNYEDRTTYTIVVGTVDGGFRLDGTTPSPCDVDYKGLFETDGRCRLSYEESVTIRVKNVNEEPLLLDTDRYINENMPKDTFIGERILGSDVDHEDELSYSIVAGNDLGLFAIEACNGQLRIADPALDYENRINYELDIQIEDLNKASMIAKVRVHVLDVNENPTASKPQPVSVLENSMEGTLVGIPLSASDIDGGHTSTLRWSLTRGNDENRFKIDSITGQISIHNGGSQYFNYETRPTDKNGNKSPFMLTTTVTDIGLLPTQDFTTMKGVMIPHSYTHQECYSDAQDNAGWINLEKDTSVGPVLSKPAVDILAAPDVKHAWVFDSTDCSAKDIVGDMNGALKTSKTSGALPSCDNDGLKLNMGNSASNGDQQYVDFGGYPAFGNEFSFAMWIKFKEETPNNARLFNLCSSNTGSTILSGLFWADIKPKGMEHKANCRCTNDGTSVGVSICSSANTECDSSLESPCRPKGVDGESMTFEECKQQCSRIGTHIIKDAAGMNVCVNTGCGNALETWIDETDGLQIASLPIHMVPVDK